MKKPDKYGTLPAKIDIRDECLKPAAEWIQPTGLEIMEVLRRASFTGSKAAKYLGLGQKGDRTVRRWTGEESEIPYSAWALLCNKAGFGCIWQENKTESEDKDNN